MTYFKLYKNGKNPEGVRLEMFRCANFVLFQVDETKKNVFWLRRSSKERNFQEVIEEPFIDEIPQGAKRVTEKYFEKLVY